MNERNDDLADWLACQPLDLGQYDVWQLEANEPAAVSGGSEEAK